MLRLTSLNDPKEHWVNIDINEYNKMKTKYGLLDGNGLEKYIKDNMERLCINKDEADILKKAIIFRYIVNDAYTQSTDGATGVNTDHVSEEREL